MGVTRCQGTARSSAPVSRPELGRGQGLAEGKGPELHRSPTMSTRTLQPLFWCSRWYHRWRAATGTGVLSSRQRGRGEGGNAVDAHQRTPGAPRGRDTLGSSSIGENHRALLLGKGGIDEGRQAPGPRGAYSRVTAPPLPCRPPDAGPWVATLPSLGSAANRNVTDSLGALGRSATRLPGFPSFCTRVRGPPVLSPPHLCAATILRIRWGGQICQRDNQRKHSTPPSPPATTTAASSPALQVLGSGTTLKGPQPMAGATLTKKQENDRKRPAGHRSRSRE